MMRYRDRPLVPCRLRRHPIGGLLLGFFLLAMMPKESHSRSFCCSYDAELKPCCRRGFFLLAMMPKESHSRSFCCSYNAELKPCCRRCRPTRTMHKVFLPPPMMEEVWCMARHPIEPHVLLRGLRVFYLSIFLQSKGSSRIC